MTELDSSTCMQQPEKVGITVALAALIGDA